MGEALPGDLPAPSRPAMRYSGHRLPVYRYVPGVRPHPVRDPAGHWFDRRPVSPPARCWRAEDWPRLEPWLYGVDLFNRFYFWEAHEVWEDLWRTAGRGSARFVLLQGLIQISGALLKAHLGRSVSAGRLSAAGLNKLQQVAARHRMLLGLDVDRTARQFDTYFAPLRRGLLPPLDDSVPVLRLSVAAAISAGEGRRRP